jgi:hypothetical protein
MSISSAGLYGSATIVNTDFFDDVNTLKEPVTTLSTSYLTTTKQHRDDISQTRLDISSNLSKINDLSDNRITAIEDDITDKVIIYIHIYIHICMCVTYQRLHEDRDIWDRKGKARACAARARTTHSHPGAPESHGAHPTHRVPRDRELRGGPAVTNYNEPPRRAARPAHLARLIHLSQQPKPCRHTQTPPPFCHK